MFFLYTYIFLLNKRKFSYKRYDPDPSLKLFTSDNYIFLKGQYIMENSHKNIDIQLSGKLTQVPEIARYHGEIYGNISLNNGKNSQKWWK